MVLVYKYWLTVFGEWKHGETVTVKMPLVR